MTDAWVRIPKPTRGGTSVLSYSGGEPIGLLLALTYSSITGVSSTAGTDWTKVAKPTVSGWSKIAKPTT